MKINTKGSMFPGTCHSLYCMLVILVLSIKTLNAMTRYGEPCFDECKKRSNWLGKDPSYYSCHKAEMYYDNIILGEYQNVDKNYNYIF